MNHFFSFFIACIFASLTISKPVLYSQENVSLLDHPSQECMKLWSEKEKDFILSFYPHVKEKEKGNFIFSPLSLQLALGMSAEVALGETQEEILAKACILKEKKLRHHSVKKILALLNLDSGHSPKSSHLILANGAWISVESPFLTSFPKQLKEFYDAKIQEVDFKLSPEKTCDEINAWVEEKTQHQIENLIPHHAIDPETKLVLVNTVYMRAPWKRAFDPKMSYQAPFYGTKGIVSSIPYMRQTAQFGYLDHLDMTVVELPFQSFGSNEKETHNERSLSLFIVLPKEEFSLEKLEKKLTSDDFHFWIRETNMTSVDVSLPKFKIMSSLNAKDILKQMGMTRPFSDEAEFALEDQRQKLSITNIVHNAVLEIDEQGGTGSAGTGITIGLTSFQPPTQVIINRPFLFFVADKTSGIVLFIGRLTEIE